MKDKDSKAKPLVPDVEVGKYSDGHPLDNVHYMESKIILTGSRFVSVDSFHQFGKLVSRAAEKSDVDYDTKNFKGLKPQIREVLFLDTKDSLLYNNAFILRRRITYEDGFLVGDPEMVLKFRHSDLQKVANMDVRPRISGKYVIKFKAEALPLKDQIGGHRILYSHNAQFPLSAMREENRTSMATLLQVFPALQTLKASSAGKVDIVSHTAVEEVLLDLGKLNFGKGIDAVANVAVWRTRGDQKQLVGEFAFQCKFENKNEIHEKSRKRAIKFFLTLQEIAGEWLSLGSTKTGIVYRLKGNPSNANE